MAKGMISFLSAVTLVFLITACSGTDTERQALQPEQPESRNMENISSIIEMTDEESEAGGNKISAEDAPGKVLVAYFSWADNAVQDDIDVMTSASVKAPGNVAQFASWIAEETGGELFSIQVTEPYPSDWEGCLNRANEEKSENMRPEMERTVEDIENYNVIFLGYPNWWYSCPMAVFSFIEAHDLGGKRIFLFCSHGTGGLAGSVRDITAALPDTAIISDNVFHVYQDDTVSAKEDLLSWLKQLDIN